MALSKELLALKAFYIRLVRPGIDSIWTWQTRSVSFCTFKVVDDLKLRISEYCHNLSYYFQDNPY